MTFMSETTEGIIKVDRKTFDDNYLPVEGFENVFSNKDGLMYAAEHVSNFVLLKFEGKLEDLPMHKDFVNNLINDILNN